MQFHTSEEVKDSSLFAVVAISSLDDREREGGEEGGG